MFTLEVILIVFCVLAGLAVNEWKESKWVEEDVETAINFISQEISNNKKWLESIIVYHTKIRSLFQDIMNDDMKNKKRITLKDLVQIEGFNGFTQPLLETTGWEHARATGIIGNFDYTLS